MNRRGQKGTAGRPPAPEPTIGADGRRLVVSWIAVLLLSAAPAQAKLLRRLSVVNRHAPTPAQAQAAGIATRRPGRKRQARIIVDA